MEINLAILIIAVAVLVALLGLRKLRCSTTYLLRLGIIFSMMCIGSAQDEAPPDFTPTVGQHPVIFPVEHMMRAEAALESAICPDDDHMLFLSDTYWPINISRNNSTVMVA